MGSRTLTICITFYLLVLCFDLCENKKSLKNFIQKKSVEKSTITILNTANDEINYTWIEYHYSFNDEHNLTGDPNFYNGSVNNFNSRINVYFNPSECENVLGRSYSSYIQNLLNVLSEHDELDFNYLNETDEMEADLLACTRATPTDQTAAILDDYYPLYAILTSGHALIYRKLNKAKDIFVLTFVGTLWLVFLVILLLLAVCLRISTYYYSRIYNGRRWTWVEITLWAIAAACQQGLSYAPTRVTSRIFFLLGYITSYVLYTAFTAAITSVLVQQETADITVNYFNVISYIVTGNRFGSYKIASHANNLTKVFEQIDTGANVALGPQILFDKYISTLTTPSFHDAYKVITLERSVGEYKDSFMLRKGLPSQQKLINQRLIRLFETGILKQIKHKLLKTTAKGDAIEGYSSASLEHVKSAIIIFLIGLGLSAVFLIMELGVYGYRHR